MSRISMLGPAIRTLALLTAVAILLGLLAATLALGAPGSRGRLADENWLKPAATWLAGEKWPHTALSILAGEKWPHTALSILTGEKWPHTAPSILAGEKWPHLQANLM